MHSKDVLARTSGLLYLLLIGFGVVGLMYVPMTLVDWRDPAATMTNISDADHLFRFGILSGVIAYVCFLALGVTLFELLRSTGVIAARLMLVFVVAGAVIGILNSAVQFNILTLLEGKDYLAGFSPEQVQAQVMYLLVQHGNLYEVANVLWGLWLMPFGYLVFRCDFLPGFLGILLMVACFEYLLILVLRVQFGMTEVPGYLSIVSTIAEFGICLWLLLAGARDLRSFRRSTATTN